MASRSKTNKLVAGVGVNDADYPIVRFGNDINGKRNRQWICPYYKTWAAMLNRCHRKDYSKRDNAYKDTTVCKEWFLFSNFKAWMEQQDWEGNEIDKDLLTDNNQYSPGNCIFIPQSLNVFISGASRESITQLCGVTADRGIYVAQTGGHGEFFSMSCKGVTDAIDFYIEGKKKILLKMCVKEPLNELLMLYIERRKSSMYKYVLENPENFPTREDDIRRISVAKVADKFVTNKGYVYEVISVEDSEHITICFEDGQKKVVSNTRIKAGQILKKNLLESYDKMILRVDKLFRISDKGLPVGIYPHSDKLLAVSYTADVKGIKYFKTLYEALLFKREDLGRRLDTICKVDSKHEAEIRKYFESLWAVLCKQFNVEIP